MQSCTPVFVFLARATPMAHKHIMAFTHVFKNRSVAWWFTWPTTAPYSVGMHTNNYLSISLNLRSLIDTHPSLSRFVCRLYLPPSGERSALTGRPTGLSEGRGEEWWKTLSWKWCAISGLFHREVSPDTNNYTIRNLLLYSSTGWHQNWASQLRVGKVWARYSLS